MAPSPQPPLVPSATEIGRLLRRLRENRGLGQRQLAEMIGTTERSLSRWENGGSYPPLEDTMRLAQALSVSIAHLTMERDAEILPLRRDRTMYFESPTTKVVALRAKDAQEFDAALDMGVCYAIAPDDVEVTEDQFRSTLTALEQRRRKCDAAPRSWLGGFLRVLSRR